MKFKVGQKVRAKGDRWFNKGELLEIVGLDRSDRTYRCKGTNETLWQPESNLEPFTSFQEKLNRFMKEPVGFLVKSKEIADELAKVFEKGGMEGKYGSSPKDIMDSCLSVNGDSSIPFVSYNYTKGMWGLSYGLSGSSGKNLDELLDVTLDELKEYLESTPQTFENKLELFKAGTHVLHTPTQEIYDKLMVELEKRGLALVGSGYLKGAKKYWSALGKYTYVLYVSSGCHCGTKEYYVADGKEIIELTLEDFKGNKQEEHMKITIETDGHHKTTAECNGVTAESLCNPTDEFKLPKGVHMAVQRLLEKLKGDTGFHVGDIVEVLGTDTLFLVESVGLQGKVEKYDKSDNTYLIVLPVNFAGSNNWWYRKSELKLIRRGNN